MNGISGMSCDVLRVGEDFELCRVVLVTSGGEVSQEGGVVPLFGFTLLRLDWFVFLLINLLLFLL